MGVGPVCSRDEEAERRSHQSLLISPGGARGWSQTLSSGAQRQDKEQQPQTKAQKFQLNVWKKFSPWSGTPALAFRGIKWLSSGRFVSLPSLGSIL